MCIRDRLLVAQLVLAPRLHILVGVVLGLAVRVFDGEAVLHGVLGHLVVVRVVDLLVHDGLDVRVLRGVDLKAAGVEEVAGLALGEMCIRDRPYTKGDIAEIVKQYEHLAPAVPA